MIGEAIGLGTRLAIQASRNKQSKASASPRADTRPRGIQPATTKQVMAVNTVTAVARTGQPDPMAKYAKTQINGALVLDNVVSGLEYNMRLEAVEDDWLIALWVMHTWLNDEEGALLTPFSPRLFLMAESGAGKTRLETIIAALSHDPIGPVSGVVTAPGVREALQRHKTVLLDEVHRYIRNPNLQGIVNQYTPVGGSLNGQGGLNGSDQYGPVALAGIRKYLKDARLTEYIDDLFTRCFVVELKKHKSKLDPIPPLGEGFANGAKIAAQAMGFWGVQLRPDDPDERIWNLDALPDDLTGRDWEISVPLVAIGDRAVDTRDEYFLFETDPEAPKDLVVPMDDDYRYRWADRARRACLWSKTGAGHVAKINDEIENMVKSGWAS